MCNTKNGGWLNWVFTDPLLTAVSSRNYKKAKKQDEATINAAQQAAQNQVENNKIANSVQTTTPVKKAEQVPDVLKTPSNTTNTGLMVKSPLNTGLNLGGY